MWLEIPFPALNSVKIWAYLVQRDVGGVGGLAGGGAWTGIRPLG